MGALQTAYPNGTTGIFVVTDDGKWYYWNGSAWTAGGIYQATGIADGSVTSVKRTVLGEIVTVQPGLSSYGGKLPNIDTTRHVLTFYKDTTFYYRNIRYNITEPVDIDLTQTSSSAKLLWLDTVSNSFLLTSYLMTGVTENHVLICAIRYTYNVRNEAKVAYMSISCPYTINGELDPDLENFKEYVNTQLVEFISERKDISKFYTLKRGSASKNSNGDVVEYDSSNRFRSDGFIKLKKGDVLKCSRPDLYHFGGHLFSAPNLSAEYWLLDIGWRTNGLYVVPYDCYYKLVGRLASNSTVEDSEITEFREYFTITPSHEVQTVINIDFNKDAVFSSANYAINDDGSVTLESTEAEANYMTVIRSIQIDDQYGVVELDAKLTDASKVGYIILYRDNTAVLTMPIDTTYYKPYILRIPFTDGGTFGVRVGNIDNTLICGCQVKNMILKSDSKPVKQKLDEPFVFISHRGDTVFAPENTMPAFINAVKKGYSMVETDIHVTADNEFVLLHDDTVDRTSNGTGNVSSLTLSELKTLDFGSWKSAKYKGTAIPTLKEFLLWCRVNDVRPLLELKTVFSSELATKFVDEIKSVGMWKRVDIISFSLSALQAVAAVDNTCRFALIGEATQSNIESTKALGNDVYFSIYGGDVEAGMDLCNENGIRFITSLNTGEGIRLTNDKGGIGICTDMINLAGCTI
ncbi:hypothetical protein ODU73_002169 [Thermoclostridium stercorarium]|uniref:glycerophosphodiester phosphodiesterase n=1 Tax=Thermoclostridium stercorarium TaxID=1510 RepID=UPI002248FA2F|nr:glycerophosphodiester phosphodiesterase family protein [Thermoclostridium stercorarium]UZQ85068.1 hypothetical protein ODU73_002169 [Thermoclostridium stercorarium]